MTMNKGLRIIFIGTPDFAVESLKCIHESGRNVVAVITSPDRKAGRGQKIKSSAVKQYAIKTGIQVLQPTNLKAADFLKQLSELKADIQVVVAFRMLPEVVWNMPSIGTFNLHASLLPNYRGAAPINWAIINGEKETGVTTFFLKHQIDTGDILLQEKVAIDQNETAGSLHDKLMMKGGALVIKSLENIEKGDYKLFDQSDSIDSSEELTHAPKIFKDDCKINWNLNAAQLDQFIRGLTPYPAAWTSLVHKESRKRLMLKIYLVDVIDETNPAGTITTKNEGLKIACSKGSLIIKELQLEGKKRMPSRDLLNGFNINDYSIEPQ